MTTSDSPFGGKSDAWVGALVSDPIGASGPSGWRIGEEQSPRAPDLAAARAARLEARLTVYARYAAIVAEEAAAVAQGDEARRVALTTARDDAAEHFAELREAAPGTEAGVAFGDILGDACYELRFQDGVDRALKRKLGVLHEMHAPPDMLLSAGAEEQPARQLDLRF